MKRVHYLQSAPEYLFICNLIYLYETNVVSVLTQRLAESIGYLLRIRYDFGKKKREKKKSMTTSKRKKNIWERERERDKESGKRLGESEK